MWGDHSVQPVPACGTVINVRLLSHIPPGQSYCFCSGEAVHVQGTEQTVTGFLGGVDLARMRATQPFSSALGSLPHAVGPASSWHPSLSPQVSFPGTFC